MADYSELTRLIERIRAFNQERDFKKFHNPKDLAISLSLEASEVLEHFQWKNPDKIAEHLREHKNDVADELADVLYWTLLMSDYFDIDLPKALERKMDQNEKKYAVDTVLEFQKTTGRFGKYSELGD